MITKDHSSDESYVMHPIIFHEISRIMLYSQYIQLWVSIY